ncbi:Abortive infection protein [Arcticibacter svalbardensis MN12-7]|uniref:Abortive infection protein n=1 Tax=Arcticibacter svalbardensis MN12-7 TaxID=1150600 RepID=R9GVS9_9SPHI|nr:type II CAAX endopeptidase family protein [Arcticibacter svalbardensis]EOR95768.1 Abortive infection protein [Arcticibacter svalbardensis MN12-7]
MKTRLNKLQALLKVLIYFSVLCMATFIAGIVPVINDFIFFFLVSLIISWYLLRTEGTSLLSLGFFPTKRQDGYDFYLGLGIGILMLICTTIITLYLTQDKWTFNQHIDPIYLIVTFLMCLWSAFVQEFVFRGYPFQTLLKNFTPWLAQLFIVIPFGLMHLDHTMSVTDAGKVMLTTGLGSILFGLTYIKTKRLVMPVGIHLGWNYAQELIPRTAGGNHSSLLKVTTNHEQYSGFMILMPFLLIVSVTIILIASCKKSLVLPSRS